MTEYFIEYIGIGGMEGNATVKGTQLELLKEITWIEEHGGWGISATNMETGCIVYEYACHIEGNS